jgi:phosphoglycerate dehydrogenase-like enzyme
MALKDGEIAGAGLDLFEKEPLSVDSPLWEWRTSSLHLTLPAKLNIIISVSLKIS